MKQVHPFQRRVLKFIHQEQLISDEDSILVAVSGGPDSVALLHVLVSLRELCGISRIAVLHFDHQLRGRASQEDRAFVEALAGTLGLPLHAGSEDVRAYQRSHRISLEMAARVCRHRFFVKAMSQHQMNKIALGHTANDQAEEILLRLFRGAGPSGMSGMPSMTAGGLIRPILQAARQEILAYLDDQKLSFCDDLSNRDTTIQRNAVRHKILPTVESHFHPKVVDVLCRTARLSADEESYWNELLADQWQKLCTEKKVVIHPQPVPPIAGEGFHSKLLKAGEEESEGLPGPPFRIQIESQYLINLHPGLRRRLLRFTLERLRGNLLGIYAVHIESLCRLLTGGTSGRSAQLPGGLWAVLEGDVFVLSREPPEVFPGVVESHSQTIICPGQSRFFSLQLQLSIMEAPPLVAADSPREDPDRTWLDAGTIKWPLFLRFRKNGDRFWPLGLKGSKKLQDFFVDCKIPRNRRGQVPLLCDQEKICWIVGHRLDDRVKVTPKTKQVLVIKKSSV